MAELLFLIILIIALYVSFCGLFENEISHKELALIIVVIISLVIYFFKIKNDRYNQNSLIKNSKVISKYFTDGKSGYRKFFIVYENGVLEVNAQEYYTEYKFKD